MRKISLLACVAALGACNMAADAREGSDAGPMTQRSYNLAGFDAVSLAGSHDVIVRVGPAHSVRAEGPAAVLDRLEIEVENGSLKIGTKRGPGWSFSGNRPRTVIHVTMPAIRAAAIGGSGDMRIDPVEGGRFAASIGGSGDMDIASLRVGGADFSIAGSGGIRAAGRADQANVSVQGSGDMDLEALETRTASVSVIGSGDVRARAMSAANVSIMGSGDVSITGSARCNVNKMGSGSLRCGS
jgi:hypothetical protein